MQKRLKAFVPMSIGFVFMGLELFGIELPLELKAKLSEFLFAGIGLVFVVSGLISERVPNKV